MNFRTIVTPPRSESKITHHKGVVMIGSCFAESMAQRMKRQLFRVNSNPFGPLYNPASIEHMIDRAVNEIPFDESEMIERDGSWYSLYCHTLLSAPSAASLATILNQRLKTLKNDIAAASHIFITFGTAYTFRYRPTGNIVGNCQKLPASDFERELMSVDQTTEAVSHTVGLLRQINSDIKIWLTVSPIRHTADGAHGNLISKSTLLLACHRAGDASGIDYFPSYEIMTDDLRDYRFYAPDMVHPSDQAADYIYERFGETFFSPATLNDARRYEKITRRLSHRPLSSDRQLIDRFKATTTEIITRLEAEHPYLSEAISQLNIEK
ncbi:MAG: GSCFA domain-containing protein [Barnesiella sp.]|nr:GSCFA domain-containing protein [Barnesiella sp.]